MNTLTALSEAVTRALMAYGVAGMVAVAFAEAWFFPIPPDVLLIAIATLNPGSALVYALLCTIASSLGGVFGWVIGWKLGRAVFAWPPLRRVLPVRYVARAEGMFRRHGGLAVAFAALTPIPYKVFTVAAGLFRVRPDVVFLASLAGRGARFFFEAAVVMAMGDHATAFLQRHLGPITLATGILAVVLGAVSRRATRAR
ncbi:MAG: YqaA family protein [Betaproteobacteria bacterium]